jgi:hypothetical protein
MSHTDHYELVLEALVAEGRAPRKVQRSAASATAGANHQALRPRAQTTAVRPIATSAASARRGSSPTTKSQIAARMRRAFTRLAARLVARRLPLPSLPR